MLPKSRFASACSVLTVALTGAAFLFACASAPAASGKKKRTPIDPGEDYFGDAPVTEEGLTPTANEDSGAFTPAAARPAPGGNGNVKDDAGSVTVDAGHGGDDAGTVAPKVFCAGPLVAGDLVVSEVLISSRAGSGDDGEWIEVTSTRTCWLKVQGLSIESPRGTTATNAASISEDFELAPKGSFVVADSADPAKNHGLPGKVFAWAGTDILKNDGDTVALKMGATVVDSVTYPAFSNLEPGRTLAFPSDCPGNVRSDWTRWSLTFDVYATGFKGTPNATNDDVACY
jgi:hypothetical protein